MKYNRIHLIHIITCVFLLTGLLYQVPSVEAQSRGRRPAEERESRALQNQIERLGRTPVENLPIPVLFGATPQNISPNFGDPRGDGARFHEGHDTMALRGTPVVSPTRAIVTRTGDGTSSGLYVNTANPGGESFVYMHLDSIADIRVGDELEVGDLIGFVGSTGNAHESAPHLHFEIRENRTALDPYPRLTEEFSLRQKAEFLEQIIQNMGLRDRDDFIGFLTGAYSGELFQIRASGIALPREVLSALPGFSVSGSAGTIQRDLDVGITGEDVRSLQVFLIGKGYLSADSATGYFGLLTQAAVMSYQREKGISPVSGYVGPLTRSALSGDMSGGVSAPGVTEAELRAKIRELEQLLEELIREYERQGGVY